MGSGARRGLISLIHRLGLGLGLRFEVSVTPPRRPINLIHSLGVGLRPGLGLGLGLVLSSCKKCGSTFDVSPQSNEGSTVEAITRLKSYQLGLGLGLALRMALKYLYMSQNTDVAWRIDSTRGLRHLDVGVRVTIRGRVSVRLSAG